MYVVYEGPLLGFWMESAMVAEDHAGIGTIAEWLLPCSHEDDPMFR